MATIVFNAVGAAYGGPVGGAIGSLFGSQLDAALLGTSHRQGARLDDLAITASSYGQPLPRHFGSMRVTGSIIWATDLVETSETQGSGKSGPSITEYSYCANFAVALASRPILGIGRIWADGNLLRGSAGDLKAGGALRIHLGGGDQATDPLILAAEGEARCPAYRGLAYAVFDNLDLADFYNRIPALTFEVFADEDFDLAAVIGDVIDDIDAAMPLPGLTGFTSDSSLADSLHVLDQVFPLQVSAMREGLSIAPARLQSAPIPLGEPFAAASDGDSGGVAGYARRRAPPPEAPASVLRYFDPARDYQSAVQHASGRASTGQPDVIDLPAALAAPSARALIERTVQRRDWSREQVFWRTAVLDPAIAPGCLVTIPATAGVWRVAAWEWRETGVEMTLERVPPANAPGLQNLPADPGRANPPVDALTGATALVAFELPLDRSVSGADTPRPFAAVSSATANWAGAALYADTGDGQLHPLGPSGRKRSVIGTATDALPAATPLRFDRSSQLVISLIDPAMQLSSADMRQLAFGANLALVGAEIIQFACAAPLGSGRWQLEGLLRGRGGTEDTIGSHAAGEPFVLLDSRPIPLDPANLGMANDRSIAALGRGDAAPVTAPILLGGITLRPLAPVHPRKTVLPDGTWRLSWTRRARGETLWRDGVDTPLVEQDETYLVSAGALDAPVLQWQIHEPRLDIAQSLIADLTRDFSGLPLHVRQRGTHALSAPLLICALP